MRLSSLALPFTFAFALSGGACSAQQFSISIGPSQQTVKTASPIRLAVRLENTSSFDLNLGAEMFVMGGLDARFEYECRNATGQSVDKEFPVAGSMGDKPIIILKPGEIHKEEVDIRQACDLSKPGKYQIQLSRSLPDDAKSVVLSNKVSVTVTP